jgi:hypothetical protein
MLIMPISAACSSIEIGLYCNTNCALGAAGSQMSIPNQTGARHESSPRFPVSLHVRLPASLPPVLDRAAEKQFTTAAEYIRRSVYERLKADGFDLSKLAEAV